MESLRAFALRRFLVALMGTRDRSGDTSRRFRSAFDSCELPCSVSGSMGVGSRGGGSKVLSLDAIGGGRRIVSLSRSFLSGLFSLGGVLSCCIGSAGVERVVDVVFGKESVSAEMGGGGSGGEGKKGRVSMFGGGGGSKVSDTPSTFFFFFFSLVATSAGAGPPTGEGGGRIGAGEVEPPPFSV